jgi:hypothetical protein
MFRAMLQINLTALATAHAVSEGIMRGVNTEMQRRNIPNTFTAAETPRRAGAAAEHAAGGQPLALGGTLKTPTIFVKIARD